MVRVSLTYLAKPGLSRMWVHLVQAPALPFVTSEAQTAPMAATAMVAWIRCASNTLRVNCDARKYAISFGRSVYCSSSQRTMAAAGGGVERKTAPYGSWKSPITADAVSGADKKLGGIAIAGDGRLIWIETRPEEGGRAVLVKEPINSDDEPIDIISSQYAARTLAQEYGGGAFTVFQDIVIFSNYSDQRLYKQQIGGGCPIPITPDYGDSLVHYADGIFDHCFNRYLTVMEDCRQDLLNPTTSIVAINIDDETIQEPKELIFGNDFYAFPRLDTTGKKIAWLGGVTLICLGIKHNCGQNGRSYLGILNHAKGSFSLLDTPFTDIGNIVVGSNCFYIEGASATQPTSIVKVTLDSKNSQVEFFSVVWSSSPDVMKYKLYFSPPEIVKFHTSAGQDAYAFFYPPSNPDYQAPSKEKPPLLLKSHGGPTAETRGILDLNVQYWTSRGWAFVDVNYGGSTGYGREYRERLFGQWGVVDVNDCCNCARFLVEKGMVDEKRLCITGRSAGGYTTLACLAFRETFTAGASLYGVADLSLMRAETHKFESRYIDKLVGDEKAYFERSPINFVDKFTCPVILFQGLADKVVPPEQARKIHKALKEKGVPVALVEYEGEQHGFRKAENIKFTLEQQMVFFARTVGHFEVADLINPIKIDNFD
ncbi:hypothetical protein HPP92_003814 [Vanilla planifolia]|uniref:Peptidase S9 prolyl oligopeptidase catalytic domain-containing protein n=1 Tax=Vanilla planifolia TaxID=51239 RepID=A0A835SGC2_VANPL|nr:hypothetical protein HPP92_004258 [Vanilla planifolia]KAG0503742.1 hypothetical protein HPP92_003814 [Vanilla planifolia]